MTKLQVLNGKLGDSFVSNNDCLIIDIDDDLLYQYDKNHCRYNNISGKIELIPENEWIENIANGIPDFGEMGE